eukprot:jgi/Tetstr1/448641/TSEL_035886.t1
MHSPRKMRVTHVIAKVRKLESARLSDAAVGPTEVFNQEPRRNMWLKLHQKQGWGFHTWDFPQFDGGVNTPATGERGFENARQEPSGDLHRAGLPITLLHEVITVAVGMH